MKVFVSSTYTDLIDYRKAAERAINLLGEQFKGMEYFGTRPEEPKTACLKEIEQADMFVGIYAHRYGFVPDGDTKSITEQEFDHAQKLGKAIFCYRVNADFPWSPKFIERGDAEKKLAAFIARIEKDFVRQEFTTPEDLLAKISPDLSRYLAARSAVALITYPLPPVPYFVHTYPLQEHFTGRKNERAELSNWLGRDPRSVLVLEAIGGIGKSALAWVWTQEIFSLGIPVAGVFWWSFYDPEGRDFTRFLEKAIEYASSGKIDPKQISSDRERVDVLANLLRQSRFLFVLDGFERVLRAYARMDAVYRGDEVDEDAHNNYRACTDPDIGIFLRCLASGGTLTKTLITSRLFPRELGGLDGVRHLQLTGMDAADAVEFFHKQGIKGTHTEIETICREYGFHPLSLRLLAGALAKDPRYEGDIKFAPRVNVFREKAEQKILEFAHNSLSPHQQKFIGELAAFRSPLKWEAIAAIFAKDFKDEDELAHAVTDLVERGLYLRDEKADTYDLHPVIRRYCYDRLSDRAATHARFVVYFVKIEAPQKIQSLADLQATIELYHHTVRAEQYDEARTLFRDRLNKVTYYQLGAYQLRIELLRALFPDGEDKPPRLTDESAQAWTLNALANSYALAGQPRRAVPLFEQHNALCEKVSDKKSLAIGLGNVSQFQLVIGELATAERNLRRRIKTWREIKNEHDEAIGHQELGRVLAYRGEFAEAERESDLSIEYDKNNIDAQGQSVDWAYRALRALLMGNASAALSAARKAREFAEENARTVYPVERDFIRAEWMIGAALNLTLTLSRRQNSPTGEGTYAEAERHLQEALARDRKIGMVDHEAAILLEFACLRFAQSQTEDGGRKTESVIGHPSSVALLSEAFNFANEALEIAERCEYRLQEAEIHNFLSDWWFAEADRRRKTEDGRQPSVVGHPSSVGEALAEARKHAEHAKERAWCDGPPYYYKVAYEKAERMLTEIEKETR